MTQKLVRVSKVLDWFPTPELVEWKSRVGATEAKRVSTLATKLGTNVHCHIEGKPFHWCGCGHKNHGSRECKPCEAKDIVCTTLYSSWEQDNCLEAFVRFKTENQFTPINYEQELYSAPHKLIGHYDCFGELNNKRTIIDWKTSSKISLHNKIQVSVYSWLTSCKHDVAIVRLDKNLSQYEIWHEPYNPTYVRIFLAMLKVYRSFNPNGEGEKDESDSVTDNKVGDRQTMDQSEDSGAWSTQDRQV